MIQKRNISTFAIGVCLLAVMLLSAAPVFATAQQQQYVKCQSIKPNGVDFDKMKTKKNCFANLAKRAIVNEDDCKAIEFLNALVKAENLNYSCEGVNNCESMLVVSKNMVKRMC